MRSLDPDSMAPDFTLPSLPGETVALASYRGQPLVLVFYPADFSPDCGDQLTLYNEVLPEFERLGARLLAVSVDNVYSHAAFHKSRNLHFALGSDFNPKGAVTRSYGVYNEQTGMSERALFVLDEAGIIQWCHVSPHTSVVPGAEGILDALEALAARTQGGP
ncbi:MAG TPA: redoxin domain-containing protein [Gemmatimonadales bacterium]|nr:redoxin domain-containing protein [Gemmatimonadales bacterium]